MGDEVYGTADGAYAEWVVTTPDRLARKPALFAAIGLNGGGARAFGKFGAAQLAGQRVRLDNGLAQRHARALQRSQRVEQIRRPLANNDDAVVLPGQRPRQRLICFCFCIFGIVILLHLL